MPAYILCRGIDNGDDPMAYKAGMPVSVADYSKMWTTTRYVTPNFFEVEITDATVEQVNAYCEEWQRRLSYEFISHDYATDAHILRVFVEPTLVSASGVNALTRDQVETWLHGWGCEVQTTALNEVVFSAGIFHAIGSPSFWGRDVSGISFSELGYDTATGIHTVEADYSADLDLMRLTKARIEQFIVSRGGTVTAQPSGAVRFEIARAVVFDLFRDAVKEAVDGPAFRRMFQFPAAVVTQALGNNGTLTATKAQAIGYLRNLLDE